MAARSGRLAFDHGRLGRRLGLDLDAAGLHGLRHLTRQVDMQQAVHQAGAGDLDVVGQLEAPLEGAPGDAAMEELAVVIRLGELARDDERVLLGGDADVALAEAGHRHGDAVGVLAEHFDVVGRIGKCALVDARGGVEQARHPVETDGGTEQGGEIKGGAHAISSWEQHGGGNASAGGRPRERSVTPRNYFAFRPMLWNRFWNLTSWPPESTRRWTPVQAGCDLGSMSRRMVSPALPMVERVLKLLPSVITTLISW